MDNTLPPEFEQADSVPAEDPVISEIAEPSDHGARDDIAAARHEGNSADSIDEPKVPVPIETTNSDPAADEARARKEAEELARRAREKLKAQRQASWEFQLFDMDRAFRVAAFNKELGERLASLNRGQRSDPILVQYRLREKSAERRREGE